MLASKFKNIKDIKFPLLIAGTGNTYKTTIALMTAIQIAVNDKQKGSISVVDIIDTTSSEQLLNCIARVTGHSSQVIDGWLMSNNITIDVRRPGQPLPTDPLFVIVDEASSFTEAVFQIDPSGVAISSKPLYYTNALLQLAKTNDLKLIFTSTLRTPTGLITDGKQIGQRAQTKFLPAFIKENVVPECKSFMLTSIVSRDTKLCTVNKIRATDTLTI